MSAWAMTLGTQLERGFDVEYAPSITRLESIYEWPEDNDSLYPH
jgi:hypothetical protein